MVKSFITYLKENYSTDRTYCHFSDSPIFPPEKRTGSSAYINYKESTKLGSSITIPRSGLFLWPVDELKTLRLIPLFSERKFMYTCKIQDNAHVFQSSNKAR